MRHGKPYRRWGGAQKRVNLLRNLVTGLVRFERIETSIARAHECQKYAERIIYVAKRGDKDPDAMRVADFWLTDKAQVHKLFKVLGQRYTHSNGPFTKIHKVGEPGFLGKMTAFIEFKGNPYPPLQPFERKNPKWLINVLLQGAQQDIHDSGLAQKTNHNITNDRSMDRLSDAVSEVKLVSSVEGTVVNERTGLSDGHDGKNYEGTPV
ncbi:putative 39S ribosomal protein L17, mitochondrial [Apostichopus japonicus]|uniref:Large ribosomal subunit protein bL17m n=1 Tax=Stichopus japonicus TaxID=307972 RepID=A0A2G8K205_STIJA|nr:putative 39S ribosomal protein L17, mitochondrial [Apostichopus japonicus]